MDVNEVTRTIGLIVAPTVMISCCTAFLNGQLQRYDAISARMRQMNQERFEILRAVGNDISAAPDAIYGVDKLRFGEIEAQLPHLLKRHKLLHDAALAIGLSIPLFVICMVIVALAAILHSDQIAILAFLIFLLGMITVLAGSTIVMFEIYKSHLAVRYEVLHALSFGERTPTLTLSYRAVKISRSA
jgi:hypothetical protein